MTEAEWLACTRVETLLQRSGLIKSPRKSRLLAVACCRCIWDQFVDDRSRRGVEAAERYADGVEAAERYADGLATEVEFRAARIGALEVSAELSPVVGHLGAAIEGAVDAATDDDPFRAAEESLRRSRISRRGENARLGSGPHGLFTPIAVERRSGLSAMVRGKWKISLLQEPIPTGCDEVVQCGLIRDLFGNPFRPVAFSPDWHTDTAVTLARTMYESRDFSTMPILADALRDAGCDCAEVLDHCRGPGSHVRGCWVVDLVLKRE